MIPRFASIIISAAKMIVRENFSLKNLNTFKVDVTSRYHVTIEKEADIPGLISSGLSKISPWLIIGGGSNLLFTENFHGILIHSEISDIKKIKEDEKYVWLKVGSGIIWDDFVEYCANKDFGGIENLSDIPGCVGAAPVQNIGAYGVEAKDTIENVTAYDLANGQKIELSNAGCKFGYRSSVFKTTGFDQLFVAYVTFMLKKQPEIITNYGSVEKELEKQPDRSVTSVRRAIINIRRSKLPSTDELGSAGSFFKNPVVDSTAGTSLLKMYPDMPFFTLPENKIKIPAAWLIEQCQLKGIRMGNVGTYEKQPLVIVNYGNATGKEIAEFSKIIQQKVLDNFGVHLEPEVCFI